LKPANKLKSANHPSSACHSRSALDRVINDTTEKKTKNERELLNREGRTYTEQEKGATPNFAMSNLGLG
jgi:hypothetical protein